MSKPYSLDLRERVVAAVEGGLSRRQAAALFDVGVSTVIRAVRGRSAALPPSRWAAIGARYWSASHGFGCWSGSRRSRT